MYRLLVRPLLFLLDPEKVHHLAFSLIGLLMKVPGMPALSRALFRPDERHAVEAFGLRFPNPIGLAAGFDKDAKLIDELANFGFGFIEIGTVTPKPQEGNPQPRLFRLPADQGLINRMGFNNGGLDQVVRRLQRRKSQVIVGGNIGKNKVTPNEDALHDYLLCFEGLYPHVDYFVVNVSSPNTPGLRELQEKGPLTHLLRELQARNTQKPKTKPILLKIAPDLTNEQLDDIVEIVKETGISGIIATNTTISREGLKTDLAQVAQIGAGGLSGKPVARRSTEVIRYLHQRSGGQIPIIGVGGIFHAEDAREKLNAGAVLVQVYTGFVYEGPGIVRSVVGRL